MLERAQLVRRRRVGREYVLSINPEALDAAAGWIETHRARIAYVSTESSMIDLSEGQRRSHLAVAACQSDNEHKEDRRMKAMRLHEPIGADGLKYEDAPQPEPAFGDVLVKVYACGITPSELYWPIWNDRAGHKRDSIIPAHEFSGVVVALGYGTAGVAVGDEVYGLIDGYRDGAAAEYIAIEARDVAPKPKTLDHVHAAAVPQAGLTSWQALFDHGHLTSGQTVVILGAGGALGLTAIQLARSVDAHVIGMGRSGVKSAILEAGADRFVDLEQEHWEDAVGQVDLVYDLIGGEVQARAMAIVKPGGALVTVVSPPPDTRQDIRIVNFIRDPNGAELVELARLVDSGRLRPQVGAVYPLADMQSAFNDKTSHRVPGKVILQP